MNIYLLTEGRTTEREIYSAWLGELLPHYEIVSDIQNFQGHSIFLFSAEGYPGIVSSGIPNSVQDIWTSGLVDLFVVALDADDDSVAEREREIRTAIDGAGGLPARTEFFPLVQKRCLESWLLGNDRFVQRAPTEANLVELRRHYDVCRDDPEEMLAPASYASSNSRFHAKYLKAVFAGRGMVYSKNDPGFAKDISYCRNIVQRLRRTGQLRSFSSFVDLVGRISPGAL